MQFLCSSSFQTRILRREDRLAGTPRPGRRGSRGFSLLEILSVLAIISVMAAISLPSISSMNQSGSLSVGGNDLADMAVLAHDYALSHNVMTALVGVSTSTAVPNAQYRAFIVMASDSSGANWTPVSKWMTLPTAVNMSSKATLNTFLSNSGTYSPSFSLKMNGTNVPNGYAYKMFFPDGHMDTSASSVVLHLVSKQNLSATSNPADYYDLVFNPMTGTVKVNRP